MNEAGSSGQGKDMEFYVAHVMAIWFLVSAWFWMYWAALLISYPFGVIALMCWYKEKKRRPKTRYLKNIPLILLIGFISSLIGLFIKLWG